jgi:hypothetical protein
MKLLILASILILSQHVYSDDTDQIIKFTEDGISFYGKFYFESSLGGDKFFVSDSNHAEIIPPGAILTVTKPAYVLGVFLGRIEVKETDKTVIITKVFFELNASGKVKFYYPSKDEDFLGKEIEGTVSLKVK